MRSPDRRAGALAIWAVEWPGDHGQLRRTLLRLAVDDEGRRVPAWEHRPEDLFNAEPALAPDGQDLLGPAEATLERELRHRGLLREHQPYSGLLVGWVRSA